MLTLIAWILIFIIALIALVKGSSLFLKDIEILGIHFGLSDFTIGLTLVALGTSLPELLSSIFAMTSKASEIIVGDVVGSNITNILLVLGIIVLLSKHSINILKKKIDVDIIVLTVSAFALTITLWDGIFMWYEGVLFLIILGVYFYITRTQLKSQIIEIEHALIKQPKKQLPIGIYMSVIISAIIMFVGARYTINAVLALSQLLHVGKEIIALTAIALGTSLPELIVSIIAVSKGKSEMVVGNILGSNIFNTFIVMAIPSFMGALRVTDNIIYYSLPVMVFATVLFLGMLYKKKIQKWEGLLLICCYILFLIKLFI